MQEEPEQSATAPLALPDFMDRSPGGVAAIFRWFGRMEAMQVHSRLYEAFSYGVAEDEDLVAIAAHAAPGQTPVNMLFASVQFLLLRNDCRDPLASRYPALSGCPAPSDREAREDVFPLFREFCLSHREQIEDLVATRRVQTNVVQRCTCLVPAMATVLDESDEPALAILEVGASAGLNLNWDHFHYTFDGGNEGTTTWGDEASPVALRTELRGDRKLPALPERIPVAWRLGIDSAPIELESDDAVLWLRSLIWPEHVERHARLLAAIDVARRYPPVVRADARQALARLLADAPAEGMLTLVASFMLYQLSVPERRELLQSIQRASRSRPIALLTMDGTAPDHAELMLTQYRNGERSTRKLADCNSHGRWIAWCDPATA